MAARLSHNYTEQWLLYCYRVTWQKYWLIICGPLIAARSLLCGRGVGVVTSLLHMYVRISTYACTDTCVRGPISSLFLPLILAARQEKKNGHTGMCHYYAHIHCILPVVTLVAASDTYYSISRLLSKLILPRSLSSSVFTDLFLVSIPASHAEVRRWRL